MIPLEKRGTVFSDYQKALGNAKKGLAYISLPNHLHARWAEAALNAGFHVVIDKPAFLSYGDYLRLSQLAKAKALCLSEATVWPYQSQVELAIDYAVSNASSIKYIQAIFSFPLLDKNNFRNSLELGGGAFNDLAAYALTPGRVFFGEEPESLEIKILNINDEVDSSFAVFCTYSGGKVLQGIFGFGTEYKNSLSLVGSDIAIEISPAFTSPENGGLIVVRKNNKFNQLTYQSRDGFAKYFQGVIESILVQKWEKWEDLLAQDIKNFSRAKRGIYNHD